MTHDTHPRSPGEDRMTDDLARTDAPERIWVDFAESPSGAMIGSVYTSDLGDIPYILATALAASPEVQALLRGARAQGLEEAARKVRSGVAVFTVNKEQPSGFNAVETLKAASDALLAEAAALRAGKGETP